MLYDNPQLARTYLSALQLTGDRGFEFVARGILDYLRRDMTHAGGALFSAEDADSLDQVRVAATRSVGDAETMAASLTGAPVDAVSGERGKAGRGVLPLDQGRGGGDARQQAACRGLLPPLLHQGQWEHGP